MSAFQKQILEMLLQSQYWPPEQMLAYQRSQLGQLLRHARAQVPFYKSSLVPVFRGNGDIDWSRWHEIPIVTRTDLRDRRSELLAVTLPPGHGPTKTFHSSGSSGVPIAMETTKIAVDANRAVAHRFYQLQGIDAKKTRATLSNSTKSGEILREEFYIKQWGGLSAGEENGGREIVLNRNLPESRKLDLLESEGAAYLFDIPNNTEVLALANLSRKIPVRLEVVLCSGQGLPANQRNLFRQSFGARSISMYSSEEGGMMGCQCGDSFHYHLNPETALVEILASDGKTCAPGEPGRVVITPFFSTALPLIRYDQGDTAELHPSCTCKSKLPVLAKIIGRQDQLLQFPDGPRSAAGISPRLLREGLNALAYQLAQVATFKLELRFVPADVNKQVNAEPIIALIRELIHPRLEVILKPVENIPLNPGGKQQRIVCEIAPQR